MDIDISKRTILKRYKSYKEIEKEHDTFNNYMIKCKCSHTILFTGIKDRLICSHCGKYVYRNKKAEMKYKVKELLK